MCNRAVKGFFFVRMWSNMFSGSLFSDCFLITHAGEQTSSTVVQWERQVSHGQRKKNFFLKSPGAKPAGSFFSQCHNSLLFPSFYWFSSTAAAFLHRLPFSAVLLSIPYSLCLYYLSFSSMTLNESGWWRSQSSPLPLECHSNQKPQLLS